MVSLTCDKIPKNNPTPHNVPSILMYGSFLRHHIQESKLLKMVQYFGPLCMLVIIIHNAKKQFRS